MSRLEKNKKKKEKKKSKEENNNNNGIDAAAEYYYDDSDGYCSSFPRHHHRVGLIGDSDIAQWPPDLYPIVVVNKNKSSSRSSSFDNHDDDDSLFYNNPYVSGHNGATLDEMKPHLEEFLVVLEHEEQLYQHDDNNDDDDDTKFLVFCAGENDLGGGDTPREASASFREVLEVLLSHSNHKNNNTISKRRIHLIVLGPKLEPWLENDASSRKEYIQLSKRMQFLCEKQQKWSLLVGISITYVDCLTMFCDCSQQQQQQQEEKQHQHHSRRKKQKFPPGAGWGVAKPNRRYFDRDELHLSRDGYQIWKDVVEEIINTHR